MAAPRVSLPKEEREMTMTEQDAHPGAVTSKAEIEAIARAERKGDVVDPQTAISAAESAAASRLAGAAAEVKQQARVVASHAATKAKAAYAQARTLAGLRARDGRTAIVERPYAAAGLVFLAGLVIGHLLSARGAQVVYLRDRREL